MVRLLRILLLALTLLQGGGMQLAAALADDACCAGEAGGGDESCPDCPLGLACGCCALRAEPERASALGPPARSRGAALAAAAAEPMLGAPGADIFHPPRA